MDTRSLPTVMRVRRRREKNSHSSQLIWASQYIAPLLIKESSVQLRVNDSASITGSYVESDDASTDRFVMDFSCSLTEL